MEIKKAKNAIYFSIIIDPPIGNGVIVYLKYCKKKEKCINPICEKLTSLNVRLDLNQKNDINKREVKYYPICANCLYKNITRLEKYC
jgi:hypothetical protein